MRRRNGFTLIELLVVVAIIALLIAILLPSLGRARDSAKRAACAANMHGYGIAIQSYITEYNRSPRTLNGQFGLIPNAFWVYNTNAHSGQIGLEALAPYMKGVNGLDPAQSDLSRITITKVWFCPSQGMGQPNTNPDVATYGWFSMNYSYFNGFDRDPWRSSATNPDDLAGAGNQAGRVLMEDSFFRWGGGGGAWDFNHGVGGAYANHQNGPKVFGPPQILGNNVLYTDYSVQFKPAVKYGTPAQLDTGQSATPHVGLGADQTFY